MPDCIYLYRKTLNLFENVKKIRKTGQIRLK